jgi:hypothetical protein
MIEVIKVSIRSNRITVDRWIREYATRRGGATTTGCGIGHGAHEFNGPENGTCPKDRQSTTFKMLE